MPEEVVDRLYRLVLRREPDPEAREQALARLADGTLSEAGLLATLVASDEFTRVRAIDDGIALASRARARGERPHRLSGPPSCDERVIEIPWVLARYCGQRRVLDVGFANAEPMYLAALAAAAPEEPVGVDLAEAAVAGFRGMVADARALPLETGSIDVAFYVSTLEHVGGDQSVYGVDAERDARGLDAALRELRRVLHRRGYALITVPCGAVEQHGWFVQHDRDGWNRLFAAADLHVHDQELYALGPAGWHAAEDAELGYGERGPGASAVLCSELHPGRFRHEAARRVRRILR